MIDKEQINDSLKNPNKNFNENFTHEKEQIIINGVNVSRCKFFNDITESYYCFGIPCKDRPNCYFKQLTLKTQECEKYKKLAADFKDVNKQLGYKYLTIKDECEKLKRKVELMMDCPDCKVDEYKKALEEIEGIIDNRILDTRINSAYVIHDHYLARFQEILDIINKADFGKSERSETHPGESCVEPVEPPIIQEAKGEGGGNVF